MASKDKRYVSSVAAFKDGLLLLGQRADDKKWCCPGGHFELNEYPTQAAMRELWEETSLVPVGELEFIGDSNIKDRNVHVFTFKCQVTGEPSSELDPDEEFTQFQWVDPNNIPDEILENLHNKQDATLQNLGLQDKTLKSERAYWLGKDGLRIPKENSPQRLIWDEAYLSQIKKTADGLMTEEYVVDISKVNGYNTIKNNDRVTLYKRMLVAGEALPPVILKYDSDGLTLVDGCHRQEALLQSGLNFTKAVVMYDETSLRKGVGLAALMGSVLLASPMNIKSHPKPTVHSIAEGSGIKAWTPEGLPDEMHPIAHLESSYGKNIQHKTNSAGEYHTAFGALGLKHSTAHEVYRKSSSLQKQFPGLSDPADFMNAVKKDPKVYNKIAAKHFNDLKARHGSLDKAVLAWRYGSGAVLRNDPSALQDKEGYLSKYKKLVGGSK